MATEVPHGFFDLATAAAMFGVSRVQFDRRYRSLATGGDLIKVKGKSYVRTRAVVDAMVAAKRAESPPTGDANERYRRIKSEREQLRLDLEKGESLPIEEVRSGFDRVVSVLTAFGEQCRRPPHGSPELHAEWMKTIDQAERAVEEMGATVDE